MLDSYSASTRFPGMYVQTLAMAVLRICQVARGVAPCDARLLFAPPGKTKTGPAATGAHPRGRLTGAPWGAGVAWRARRPRIDSPGGDEPNQEPRRRSRRRPTTRGPARIVSLVGSRRRTRGRSSDHTAP